ncbi:MAG: alpha-glucosidase C-terminal domain-containing protein, partial [Anaerolineaceae bacterium]|nr:alpha-glucosidase C-terminal domain-containing protein [Anaerolineaceae bacterium]
INCTWEICRVTMTDVIHAAENLFCQPEGAGGFGDDPVPWVESGGWNCIMDYSIKLWWEGIDVIRDALHTGDPRPVEAALRGYRDRVVAAGGVCYIDPPNLADLPLEAQLMGAALTASMGELILLLGDLSTPLALGDAKDPVYRDGLDRLLLLRRRCPALCAGGKRVQIPTSDDTRFYAFLRGAGTQRALAVFNFQSTPEQCSIDLSGQAISVLENLLTGENVIPMGETLSLNLPAFGYYIYKI